MTPTRWRSQAVHGLPIAIEESWRAVAGKGFAWGTDGARVDVVMIPAGGLIDPARVDEVRAESPLEQTIVSAELVRVGDRFAVKVVIHAEPKISIIKYVVGGDPLENEGEILFPEVRVVYVLAGPWRNRVSEIAAEMREAPLGDALEGHSISETGHLEFGPVPVPGTWVAVGEEEERIPLAPATSIHAEVFLCGGYIVIEDPQPPHSTILFQPIALVRESTEGGVEGIIRKRLSADFPSMTCDSSTLEPIEFLGGQMAHRYVLSSPTLKRLGFVWQDPLQYWWELVYVLQERDWRWMSKEPLFRAVVPGANLTPPSS